MGIDSIKRALRGFRSFARRLPTAFHVLQPVSEKHVTPASGSDDCQDITSDSLSTTTRSALDDRAEHDTDAATKLVHPSTDFENRTGHESVATPPQNSVSPTTVPPAFRGDRDYVCRICGNWDSRFHRNDGIHALNHHGSVVPTTKDNLSRTVSLPFSLLWESEARYADDGSNPCPRPGPTPSGHYAPSWSPVSVTCRIRYGEASQHMGTTESTCEVLDIACQLASPDPFPPVHSSRSTITIRGLISDVKCRVDPVSNRHEVVCNVLDRGDGVVDWSIRLAQDVLPPRSMAKEWDKVEEKLAFLPVIYSWSMGNGLRHVLTIEGLALRRVAGMADYFTRVGTIRLQFWASRGIGLSWQDLLAYATTGVAEQIVTII